MDRDEYLRRASALEERAADCVYPGLRAALLNTAALYRNRANQTVVRRADAKLERVQASGDLVWIRSTQFRMNWTARKVGVAAKVRPAMRCNDNSPRGALGRTQDGEPATTIAANERTDRATETAS